MSKQDLPDCPPVPPRKRRQLHEAPDVWIATWLSGQLTTADRRRLEDEKQRRKKDAPVTLVVLKPREGLTPEQKRVVRAQREAADETDWWISGFGRSTYQEVVKGATRVVAAPKETFKPERAPDGSVWAAVRYARQRGLDTQVVLPSGELLQEEG